MLKLELAAAAEAHEAELTAAKETQKADLDERRLEIITKIGSEPIIFSKKTENKKITVSGFISTYDPTVMLLHHANHPFDTQNG